MSTKNILCEEDIEGLIKLGAPPDEYNSEAEEIEAAMSRLGDKRSEGQLVQVLEHVGKRFLELSAEDIELRSDAFDDCAYRTSTCLYSHGLTALVPARIGIGGPLTVFTFFQAPSLETTTSNVTLPCSRAAFARGG